MIPTTPNQITEVRIQVNEEGEIQIRLVQFQHRDKNAEILGRLKNDGKDP